MAEPKEPAAKALPKPNPVWKYLGFGENFRPRLPGRNWMIFLSVTGAFTTAVVYDKREKKRAQRRWAKAVEHIGKEPLPDSRAMPRKISVLLEAPPGDGLRIAQDHFKEYVKPILVASGLDWEFIQGRKEGDVRAEIAEKIRNSRLPPDEREEDAISETRRKSGIPEFDGARGDIVIGRHTWKEYVRGVHEGWLGPLTEPPKSEEKPVEAGNGDSTAEASVETMPGITIISTPREADDAPPPTEEAAKPDDKPKKPAQPPPFITTAEYSSASAPADLPTEFDPSQPIEFPHILGFLNTPKRLYRFLNRRHLADRIGRETAAVILATYRPYHTTSTSAESSFSEDADQSPQGNNQSTPQTAEQQAVLTEEEKEWHKSVRVRKDGEPERTWLEPVVLDPRIASRMRRFELTPEEETRAKAIVVPEEEVEGWIKGSLRSLGREGLKAVGFGKEMKQTPAEGDEEVLE
ncbi:related to TIM54 (component of the mitochondrial TIM22 translocase) [Phialocephala subalpina]|uniref:Mitochondrial import inner membrane translocase subunit TIM54 n=1 Tax=Phialocephala subalpina TaxID=576137 RepID=A0A1L7XAN3_9HELO|nr:related to TIM54 (component of the mitochondrial TIM22 translocase) [Phialocephala subalpina]